MPVSQKETTTIPKNLRPYLSHGLDLSLGSGDRAIGDCPFCGAESKFSVDVVSGLWRCFVCNEGSENGQVVRGGNAHVFLRKLHEMGDSQGIEDLTNNRKMLHPETLTAWGVVRSPLTGEWLIPGYSAEGKLGQLYRYSKAESGKMVLKATAEMGHQLHGVNLFKPKRKRVFLCEGPWDAMALWEVLGASKKTDDGYAVTANEIISLRATCNVLAAPGCNTFFEAWLPLFTGAEVCLLYDSDHPKEHPPGSGKTTQAGYDGMKRVAQMLARAESLPESIHYLNWGEKGYDPGLPSGYDVRDMLSEGKDDRSRVIQLGKLLGHLEPIPEDWVGGRTKESASKGGCEVECLPCEDWDTCVAHWRKAMKWIPGLDCALSVMLASIVSTRAIGSQLWVRCISPPSCLDGETPIHDPVSRTTKTVAERCQDGLPFYVYSRLTSGELGIAKADPPKQYPVEAVYKVSFESGAEITVTAGHRFWIGGVYLSLSRMQSESSSYLLPTISGNDLLTRLQGALHSMRKAQGSQSGCCACSCPCGGQLHPAEDIDQYVSPLPIDAQECNLVGVDDSEGSLCRCTPRHQIDHPSSYQTYLHCEERKDESLLLSSEGAVLRSPWWSRICSSIRQLWHQLRKKLLGHQSSPLARSVEPEPLLAGGHETQGLGSYQESWPPPPENYPPSTAGHTDRSCVVANYAERQGESSLSSPSNSDGVSPDQFASGHKSLQRSCQSCRGRQPTVDALQTTGLTRDSSLSVTDAIVKVEYVGDRPYYDFHVPGTENYWACGFFHHNSGKSILCEALSVAKNYVYAKSTLRGFHSGYDDGSGENHSPLAKMINKTLVVKDGDTLLQSPNLSQILSEARDIYDRTSRSSYRTKQGKDWAGLNITIILCGTAALRQLDSSELGERFLTCSIMDEIDEELEDEILLRVAHRAVRGMSLEADGSIETQHDPDMLKAMQLTGGYVNYLRTNATELLSQIEWPDGMLMKCQHLGKFVSYIRARPSIRQDEKAEREFAPRLVEQHIRLAQCLAVVLNRKSVDKEVMSRVRKVAMDTAKGRTLDLCKHIYAAGADGIEAKALAYATGFEEQKERILLRFLKRIGAVDYFVPEKQTRARWVLTPRLRKLFVEIFSEDTNAKS